MKFKTPTGKTIGTALETAGGVIIGAKLSQGVAPLFNDTLGLNDPMYGQLAVIGIGGLLAAAATGNDTAAKWLRNSGIGMVVQQGKDLIADLAQPMLPEKDGSTVNEFINNLFGNNQQVEAAPAAVAGIAMGNYYNNPEMQFLGNMQEEISFAA